MLRKIVISILVILVIISMTSGETMDIQKERRWYLKLKAVYEPQSD